MKKNLFHYLFLQLLWCLALFSFIQTSGQSCQFQQGQNGGVGQPAVSPVQFERGNSNGAKSHFAEGYSVPYRIEFTTLQASQQYKVRISFDVKKNGKFAFDYITGYQNLELNPSVPSELVDPLFGTGLAGVGGIGVSTLTIPSPNFSTSSLFNATATSSFSQLKSATGLNPETTLPVSPYSTAVRNKGNMALWNGVINSIQYVGSVNLSPSTVSVSMDVVFTKANNANNVVLAWGGHIASLQDWGQGNSASAIAGSPYHMYVETVIRTSNNDVLCNGNMDCQIASDAVTPAPTCSITGPSRLCESSTIANYKATLDAAENGAVSYVWSLINLSSGTPPQLVGSGIGTTSLDSVIQSVIPSDSFLVRLRVSREGIYNYCYLNSVDSPGTKVKRIKIDVEAQATPTVLSLNTSSTSQLNTSIQLDGVPTSAGFSYQWTILGPGGYAAGSLSNSTISNPVFTATMAGDYLLKVVITQLAAPNCTDSAQVMISVLPTQSCPSLITQSVCAASQLSVPVLSMPQAGVDYNWSVTNGASIISEGGDSLITILAGAQDFTIQLQLSYANPLLSNLTCNYPVIVHPIPIVSAGEISPTCETAMPISLGGLPAGGTWSGVGVSGTTFSPSVAGAGTFVLTYYYTDRYGCTSVKETTVKVEVCLRTNACTYTQGYYGSTNGRSCDGDSSYRNAISLIKKLLTPSPIIIGSGGRTLTISVSDSVRLNAVLPGGGTPFTFSHTGNITLQSSQFALYKTSKGRINNILLSQTITLALNNRIKADLNGFELQNGYLHTQAKRSCFSTQPVTCQEDPMAIKAWKMIPSVVNYLRANSAGTVGDLLALANAVLGRTKVPGQSGLSGTVVPSLGDIVAQIDVINNAFDGCRLFVGYFPALNLCPIADLRMETATAEEAQQEIAIKETQLKVFPNPFESIVYFSIQTPLKTKVSIELFDMQGKLLQQQYVGEVMPQEKRQVEVRINKNSDPILYRVTTTQRVFSGILLPMH